MLHRRPFLLRLAAAPFMLVGCNSPQGLLTIEVSVTAEAMTVTVDITIIVDDTKAHTLDIALTLNDVTTNDIVDEAALTWRANPRESTFTVDLVADSPGEYEVLLSLNGEFAMSSPVTV